MNTINLLIKPYSHLCNLECTYCFYKRVRDIYRQKKPRMSIETAEIMLKKVLAQGRKHNSFCWQGGEPTLLGIDFYRKIIDLQNRFAMPHQSIENSIQTNGILLNQEWADFLRKNNFLVGLSLDGTESIHDKYRKFPGGKGTFKTVFQKTDLLKKNNVSFNILTLLTDANIHCPGNLYSFFKKNAFSHLQFIPCMEKNSSTLVSIII